jgi:hypothetical protein
LFRLSEYESGPYFFLGGGGNGGNLGFELFFGGGGGKGGIGFLVPLSCFSRAGGITGNDGRFFTGLESLPGCLNTGSRGDSEILFLFISGRIISGSGCGNGDVVKTPLESSSTKFVKGMMTLLAPNVF